MDTQRRLRAAVVAVLLVAAVLLVPLPEFGMMPATRHISISARQFAFEPFGLRVNRGDTLTIDLEALDARHGLALDGYDVDIQAEPGRRAQVTFVADKPGRFKFRCSVSCGNLHPFMIGEILVDPNTRFTRAIVATAITTIGALALFWKR